MPLRNYYPGSRLSTTATRGTIAQSDTDGGAQGVAWGTNTDPNAEVLPSDDLDVFQPYGFTALPPADMEYVEVDSTAGPAIVGFRAACPVTLASGESAHWFDANTYAHAKSGEYGIKSALVKAHNGGAVDFVALAAKVLTELGKIETAFNTHTHTGVTVGAGVTGGPSAVYAKASVAATILKAE